MRADIRNAAMQEMRKNMKRQTVILATFLIAVFATATIFAEVAAAQQPIPPTTKITTATKDTQNQRGPQYYPYRPYPIYRPPYYPPYYPPYFPPYHPPYYPPIYYHPPYIYRPIYR